MQATEYSWRWAASLLVALCWSAPIAAQTGMHPVPAGKALVYVIQGETGKSGTLAVSVDGKSVGTARANTWFAFAADPGTHLVSATASVSAATRIRVEANKAYYLSQRVNAGGVPEFRVIPPSEAQPLLERYRAERRDVVMTGAAPATPLSLAKKPAAVPAPPRTASRDNDSLLLFKFGMFKLSEESQEWLGVASTVDADASSAIAIEYDHFFPQQWTLGAELVSYKNSWTRANGTRGSLSTLAFLANGKKYFHATDIVRPFVGAGVGFANTDFSGDLTGGGAGVAYQLLGGVEFRFRGVGAHLEYKWLSADTDADNDVQIDASGSGFFAGVAVNF